MCKKTEQLTEFLKAVDQDFPVPLSQKQDLHRYAEKLTEYATICAVCSNGTIRSLVAGYTDHVPENLGYISMVATRNDSRGQGLAKTLVRQFLDIAREKGLDGVHLYAAVSNKPAVRMYRDLGFVEYLCDREPRPDDLHLICYLKE